MKLMKLNLIKFVTSFITAETVDHFKLQIVSLLFGLFDIKNNQQFQVHVSGSPFPT